MGMLIELRVWFLTVMCFACPLTRGKFPTRTKSVVSNSGIFFLSPDTLKISLYVELTTWFLTMMCFACPLTRGKLQVELRICF